MYNKIKKAVYYYYYRYNKIKKAVVSDNTRECMPISKNYHIFHRIKNIAPRPGFCS